MSATTIKIKLNEAGRAVANFYGKDFDVTDHADKSGKGELKAFGKTYQFEIMESRREIVKGVKKLIADAAKIDGEDPNIVDSREIKADE